MQGCIELNEGKDGSLSISIDDYALTDEGLVNFLKQYLGRGKFEVDADAEKNVEA